MGTFVPCIHFVKLLIALMYHQHRAFSAAFQIGARNNDSDFENPIKFRIKAGHFTIKPNQVLLRFVE